MEYRSGAVSEIDFVTPTSASKFGLQLESSRDTRLASSGVILDCHAKIVFDIYSFLNLENQLISGKHFKNK